MYRPIESSTATSSSAACMASSVGASTTGSSTASSRRRAIRRRSTSHSSSAAGYPNDTRSRNRSSCASGSGYVPSYSIGFAVASTWNGALSTYVVPSTETCFSCIASSRAACVLGGVRLISSASSRFVNTGPGRNVKSWVRWSYRNEPVTSAGSRSGVNWRRRNPIPSACANERAVNVLPRPGRSSSSTCPPARMPASTSSRASRLPTTTVPTRSRTSAPIRPTSSAASLFSVTVPPCRRR